MEPNGTNQNRSPATVIQCRMGCGFYGSVANDNMCSKCYKEFAKAGQEEEEPDKAGHESSSSDRANGQITRPVESPLSVRDSSKSESAADNLAAVCSALNEASISSSVCAAASTPAPVSLTGNIQITSNSRASPADCSSDYGEVSGESDLSSAKPKKNRCHTCRKRVGLTGFQCRCEGLFCSLHRYSDQHNCSFDYREHGQEDIRKNNPRVVSEKVRKI